MGYRQPSKAHSFYHIKNDIPYILFMVSGLSLYHILCPSTTRLAALLYPRILFFAHINQEKAFSLLINYKNVLALYNLHFVFLCLHMI